MFFTCGGSGHIILNAEPDAGPLSFGCCPLPPAGFRVWRMGIWSMLRLFRGTCHGKGLAQRHIAVLANVRQH